MQDRGSYNIYESPESEGVELTPAQIIKIGVEIVNSRNSRADDVPEVE